MATSLVLRSHGPFLKVPTEKAVVYGFDLLLQDTGAQLGGVVVNYQSNLAFLKIHGSGHMVPQFRPQAALYMLTKMIQNEMLLSPLLPKNSTLSSMSDAEFSKAMADCTELAKAAPFVSEVLERRQQTEAS